jgi:hypothetical protein
VSSGIGKSYLGGIFERFLQESIKCGDVIDAPIRVIETSAIVRRRYDELHGTNTLGSEEEKFAHRVELGALARRLTDEEPDWQTREGLISEAHTIVLGIRDVEGMNQMLWGGAFLLRITASHVVKRNQLGEEAYRRHLTDPREHELDQYKHWHATIRTRWHPNQSESRKRDASREFTQRADSVYDEIIAHFT